MNNICSTLTPMKAHDLTGQKFGKWSVLHREASSSTGKGRWLCRCECGAEYVVYTSNLRGGKSRSCQKCKLVTHGDSKNPQSLYTTWEGMKQRTTNPRNPSFKNYGGRGIVMLDGWLVSYTAFRDWVLANLGERPAGTTLDRINNDGNYEPGNLRWATKKEQQNNRRAVS